MTINRRQFNHRLIGGLFALPLRGIQLQSGLAVNGKRIVDHILALAEFGKNPQGGVSRVAYSDADKQGREYVLGLMRAAKLDVKIDGTHRANSLAPKTSPTARTCYSTHYSNLTKSSRGWLVLNRIAKAMIGLTLISGLGGLGVKCAG